MFLNNRITFLKILEYLINLLPYTKIIQQIAKFIKVYEKIDISQQALHGLVIKSITHPHPMSCPVI